MAPQPKEQAIIYLERNKLHFFGSNIQDRIATCDVPQTIIRDLEIIAKDQFFILIKNFIDYFKITPAKLVIVLADAIYYQKDLVQLPDADVNNNIDKFLNFIPFENTVSKTYRSGSGMKVIAVNQDLYQIVMDAFIKQGFTVEAVIPEFITGKSPNFRNTVDIITFRMILEKFDSWRENSLLSQQHLYEAEVHQEKQKIKEIKPKSSLIYLLPAFVILLAVLGYLVINQQQSPPVKNNIKTAEIAQEQPVSSSPTPQPSIPATLPATTIIQSTLEQMRIQIVNAKGVTKQAELVKSELEQLGYKNVDASSSSNLNLASPTLLFSKSINPDFKYAITSVLKKRVPNVTVQDTSETVYDVVFIISPNTTFTP